MNHSPICPAGIPPKGNSIRAAEQSEQSLEEIHRLKPVGFFRPITSDNIYLECQTFSENTPNQPVFNSNLKTSPFSPLSLTKTFDVCVHKSNRSHYEHSDPCRGGISGGVLCNAKHARNIETAESSDFVGFAAGKSAAYAALSRPEKFIASSATLKPRRRPWFEKLGRHGSTNPIRIGKSVLGLSSYGRQRCLSIVPLNIGFVLFARLLKLFGVKSKSGSVKLGQNPWIRIPAISLKKQLNRAFSWAQFVSKRRCTSLGAPPYFFGEVRP